MGKVIIGIHGLGNKPSEHILKEWWLASINEALAREAIRPGRLHFELAYWADCLYDLPQDITVSDENSSRYIASPYVPSIGLQGERADNELRKKILKGIKAGVERLLFNEDLTARYSLINEMVIHYFFRDYKRYYTDYCYTGEVQKRAKEVIDERLADILWKNRRKKILLICHSMGSVIAWHVLTGIVPFVPIDTLITIGSPLGLPVIRGRLLEENRKTGIESTSLKTPENIVHNWYNLTDQKDPITMDYSLGDIFEANSRGVKVIDRNVHNDYEYNTVKNHHKVYGYLRTPELAEITKSFLKRTPFRAWARIKDLLGLKY